MARTRPPHITDNDSSTFTSIQSSSEVQRDADWTTADLLTVMVVMMVYDLNVLFFCGLACIRLLRLTVRALLNLNGSTFKKYQLSDIGFSVG
jgi:hypothetical protein